MIVMRRLIIKQSIGAFLRNHSDPIRVDNPDE